MQDKAAVSKERIAPAIQWRGAFKSSELHSLHAECFEHEVGEDDWWAQLNRASLGWVCARLDDRLVGFVNVAWDGGAHAFILDTMVTSSQRRRGLASRLVAEATIQARARGCQWLHVDFERHLRAFYFDSCGFKATDAGLIALK